ncbi:MAG: hypothetical protein AMXMBFR84_44560 [Candidatus Hydrogenedentota bacterium]
MTRRTRDTYHVAGFLSVDTILTNPAFWRFEDAFPQIVGELAALDGTAVPVTFDPVN